MPPSPKIHAGIARERWIELAHRVSGQQIVAGCARATFVGSRLEVQRYIHHAAREPLVRIRRGSKGGIARGDTRALRVGLGLHRHQSFATAHDEGQCLFPCSLIALVLCRCQRALATVLRLADHADLPLISGHKLGRFQAIRESYSRKV